MMDLITQGILGAAVAQAGFQKKLGKKAVFWGAIIGMVPDLDVLVKFPTEPLSEQLYHRGFTHSLFFAPLIAPLFALLLSKLYDNKPESNNQLSWFWLAFWALITHPLLDLFTTYGTQLLCPLTNHRFSLSAISIIDPVYSIPLLMAVVIGLFKSFNKFKAMLTSLMLLLTTSYLFYGLACNQNALNKARESLGNQGARLINSYPTLFQIHVRRIVAHIDNQVWIAYVSTYPGTNYPVRWEKYNDAPKALTQKFMETREAKIYKWFCDNDCIMIHSDNVLKMQDLRFGVRGPAELGIWGLEAEINANGELKYAPVVFRNNTQLIRGHSNLVSSTIYQLFNASLGYESKLLGIHD